MRKIVLLALTALSLVASGCAQPQYWVKGLTLPPGSTEKSRTVSNTKVADGKAKLGAPQDGSLLVYFDSTSSWDAVAAHIGEELRQQGFTEMSNSLKDMGGSAAEKLGGGMAKDMATGFLDYSRNYSKEGYAVTLTNMKSIVESKILSKFRKGGDKAPGQYMLMVTKSSGTNYSEPGKVEVPTGK
jgi:hypothetical protein